MSMPQPCLRSLLPLCLCFLLCAGLLGCPNASRVRKKGDIAFYDIKLNYMDNEEFPFRRLKGQVVLLDFFSTSCMVCLTSVPYMKAMHKRYKGKGLSVIGIAMEKQPLQILPVYTSSQKIQYPVLIADKTLFSGKTLFKRRFLAIPRFFLIDKCGVLRGEYQRPKDFTPITAQIKKLLAENPRCAK